MSGIGCIKCGKPNCTGLACEAALFHPTVPATEEATEREQNLQDGIQRARWFRDAALSLTMQFGSLDDGAQKCADYLRKTAEWIESFRETHEALIEAERPVTPQAAPKPPADAVEIARKYFPEEYAADDKWKSVDINFTEREHCIVALTDYAKPLVERIAELEGKLSSVVTSRDFVRMDNTTLRAKAEASEAKADSLQREVTELELNLTIKDCKQCHGSTHIIDSESGGFPARCHCYQVRCNELRSERDALAETLRRVQEKYNEAMAYANGRWGEWGTRAEHTADLLDELGAIVNSLAALGPVAEEGKCD